MFHRLSPWWRALSVVLLSLATVPWPVAAQASTSPRLAEVSQESSVVMNASGTAHFQVSLRLPPGARNLAVSLYPALIYRSQISDVINNQSPGGSPLATAHLTPSSCAHGGRFLVAIASRGSVASQPCGAATPTWHLPCVAASCSGVYPVSFRVSTASGTQSEWSLVAISAVPIVRPLRVSPLAIVDPSAWTTPQATIEDLRTIGTYPRLPIGLAVDYRALTGALVGSAAERAAIRLAATPAAHYGVVAPPSNIDEAGLFATGNLGQVAQQLSLGAKEYDTLTHRRVTGVVDLRGPTSNAALAALAHVGVRHAIVSDNALSPAPSTTLSWGAPMHVSGTPVVALATDDQLGAIVDMTNVEPARRSALALGSIAFLHFEAPNLKAARAVVIPMNLATMSSGFLQDFFTGLTHSPFVTTTAASGDFSASLVGTTGGPQTTTFLTHVSPSWTSLQAQRLHRLIARATAFTAGVGTATEQDYLTTSLLEAQIVGTPTQRAQALHQASALLNDQLNSVRIDSSTVTLAGAGNDIPITIFSQLHYPITLVVRLTTDRLHFPHGANIPVTLNTPTTSLRIPTSGRHDAAFILQVALTTPNGRIVLSRQAIQVRVEGVSWVGYLLSISSLLTLLFWWWRTHHRRRLRGAA